MFRGQKEDYIIPMNDFVSSKFKELDDFLLSIVKDSDVSNPPEPKQMENVDLSKYDPKHIHKLHTLIYDQFPKFSTALLELGIKEKLTGNFFSRVKNLQVPS